MKRLWLLLPLLLVACGPTITPSTQGELLLIAEQGEVRLEAVAPMLWARVALKGDVQSTYCEKPNCEAEQGVVYLALPEKATPYAVRTPVATYDSLKSGAAVATLIEADESYTAQLERR